MKKYSVLTLAIIAAFSVQSVAMAETVIMKSDNAMVSYTYSTEKEAVLDAGKLFAKIEDLADGESITDAFTITNKTDGESIVEISLRMSVEPTSDAWLYSPLDYYSIVISDEAGVVIYDSADAELSDVSDVNKDIVLGSFNDDETEDTKTYNVEYKISENGAANLSKEDVSDLTFSLVVNEVAQNQKPVSTVNREPKPKFELETTTPPVESEEVESEKVESVKVNELSQPDGTPVRLEGETPVKEKKLVCGTDIDAGRYVVTGNGIVKVESATGTLESEATLNDGTVEGVIGAESTIITISNGDVLILLPLEGQEKASVSLEKTNSGSSASNTTRDTTTTKTATGKTNPKTGEASTVAVSVVMVLAIAGISVLEILKRKRAK